MLYVHAVRTVSEGYVQGSHSYGAIPQGTPAAGTLGGTGGSVGSGVLLVFFSCCHLWLSLKVMVISYRYHYHYQSSHHSLYSSIVSSNPL